MGRGASWKADNGDWFNLLWIFPVAIIGMAYAFLFKPVINYGERYLFLKAMRDEEADLKLLFEGFRTKYLKIVLANLIVVALANTWFCNADYTWHYYFGKACICPLPGNG
jgi:hypothetical protein